jgi:hypothetical protein
MKMVKFLVIAAIVMAPLEVAFDMIVGYDRPHPLSPAMLSHYFHGLVMWVVCMIYGFRVSKDFNESPNEKKI